MPPNLRELRNERTIQNVRLTDKLLRFCGHYYRGVWSSHFYHVAAGYRFSKPQEPASVRRQYGTGTEACGGSTRAIGSGRYEPEFAAIARLGGNGSCTRKA